MLPRVTTPVGQGFSPACGQAQLRRVLGPCDLTALGINGVIGAGVFLAASPLVAHIGAWAPVAIVLAGVATLAVALCFAEVSSRFDLTGGQAAPLPGRREPVPPRAPRPRTATVRATQRARLRETPGSR